MSSRISLLPHFANICANMPFSQSMKPMTVVLGYDLFGG
jgi:hypothetical protein